MRVHTGERLFCWWETICLSHCFKKFATKRKVHVRVHTKEENYTFAWSRHAMPHLPSSSLKQHMRTHTGWKTQSSAVTAMHMHNSPQMANWKCIGVPILVKTRSFVRPAAKLFKHLPRRRYIWLVDALRRNEALLKYHINHSIRFNCFIADFCIVLSLSFYAFIEINSFSKSAFFFYRSFDLPTSHHGLMWRHLHTFFETLAFGIQLSWMDGWMKVRGLRLHV